MIRPPLNSKTHQLRTGSLEYNYYKKIEYNYAYIAEKSTHIILQQIILLKDNAKNDTYIIFFIVIQFGPLAIILPVNKQIRTRQHTSRQFRICGCMQIPIPAIYYHTMAWTILSENIIVPWDLQSSRRWRHGSFPYIFMITFDESSFEMTVWVQW